MNDTVYRCDCGTKLDWEPCGDRDMETMGGLGVEYLRCPRCGQGWSYIEGDEEPCMVDSPPPDEY